eukprot:7163611-Pyramimonas_sp.AAC.1
MSGQKLCNCKARWPWQKHRGPCWARAKSSKLRWRAVAKWAHHDCEAEGTKRITTVMQKNEAPDSEAEEHEGRGTKEEARKDD